MIRGKTGFWLLTIIFAVIIAITVMNAENYGEPIVSEMDGTMGSMMKNHHDNGAVISKILGSNLIPPVSAATAGHHSLDWYITSLNSISFAAIFLIMPLLLGVSVFMIILWM